jgi:hypothetical protein
MEAAPWVIAINQSFARKFFPNEDPIGQQILLRYDPYAVDELRPRQIIGIVGDVKHFGLGEETPPFVYAPFTQQPAVFPGGAARAHLHKALVLRTQIRSDIFHTQGSRLAQTGNAGERFACSRYLHSERSNW